MEDLNPEQQEAVLALEGPTLILAGAGTGKTRVIAHRIAYLLQTQPQLTPANLLALAFSRKAAQEMLERVEGLRGAYADELGVFTFHGFCHRFLQDHALECGLPARFQLLDRTESWIFFRRLLPELKLAYHWNLADPTDCINGFLRFISRAKDELVAPQGFAEYLKGVTDPRERIRLKEVERAYRIYQKRMREAGCLDFGDLIVEALRVLHQWPALLSKLQSQYRFILVDEFQDTNVAQIKLLTLLAGKSGNLSVVGDDDQAIYRFRGASFASFLLLKEAFPQMRTLRLTRNYRSTPKILSVAGRLIRHNEPDRYDSEKRLWTEGLSGQPIQVAVCRDEFHEAQGVVETIRTLVENQPQAERRFDRIAILYRAHAHKDHVVETLRQAGIPFFVHQGSLLFEQPEIQELIALLRVLHDPSDGVSLFRTLSHPIWGIPTQDLVTLNRCAKEREIPLREMLDQAGDLALTDSTKAALSQLIQELSRMAQVATRRGVDQLIPMIAEETSLRTIFRVPLGQGRDSLIFLGRFLRFTYRYAQTHPQARDLASFLWYLESYLQAGGDPQEEEQEQIGNQVHLMTIHQAKGLEFDWVILLNLVQGRFPSRGRPEPIPFPVELMKEPLPQGDYHLQEERRLCYVACTRARQGLFLMTQERAYHRPSIFVREMLEQALPEEIDRRDEWKASPDGPFTIPLRAAPVANATSASLAVERQILQHLQRIRSLELEDKTGFSEAIHQITELASRLHRDSRLTPLATPTPSLLPEAKFSFTQLQTYRYCPLKYQYSYLYSIPVKPTAPMTFGTDVHTALETFFRRIMEGETPSLEELLEGFRLLYIKGRYGEPYQDEEYRRLGMDLLTAFYKKHEGNFTPPLFVEKPFLLRLKNAWIRGFVDRVDPLPGGGVEIIDYKTGRPKAKADPQEQLQLRLYALAAQEVFGLEPKKVSFYYLRNNQKLSFEQEPQALEETRNQIQALVSEIRTSDFTPTPSLMKCRRCDFRNLCPASMA